MKVSLLLFLLTISEITYAQSLLLSTLQQKPSLLQAKSLGKIEMPKGMALFTQDFTYKETLAFSVHNDLESSHTCYLHIGTDNIFKFSSVDLVRSIRGMPGIAVLEVVEEKQFLYNGYLTPISQRQYPANLQVLFIEVPAHKTYTLRLHIFDLAKGFLPNIKIMNSDTFIFFQGNFLEKTKVSAFISNLYVGALCVMVIFIAAIYSRNKMQDFGLYALYLLGILLFGIADMYPLNFKDVWAWNYPKIFIYIKESTVYLYLIFYHLFIAFFLQTKNNKISLHHGLIWTAYLYTFLLSINLISILFFFEANFIYYLTWVNTYVFYSSILFYIYLFVMIWKLKNIPFSRYIFWGSFMFYLSNVGAICLNITTKGVYPHEIYPNNFIQIGAIIEILFFAVALGRKALMDSEEKNKLQKQVIEQLSERKKLIESINERLEVEVAEKTEEIVAQTQNLQEEKEEKMRIQFQNQLQEMRLYAIQTQLNPHFLFNCLNTIKSLVLNKENDKAAVYLSQFAKLMRNTLENSEKLKINLKDSIEYLKNYVEMERLRFKEDFDFEITFEGEEVPELLQVPPMLIQPFVENAIIHGLVPSKNQKKLSISFIEQEDFLLCNIADNGKGFDTTPKNNAHKSKGLEMIQNYFDLWNAQKNEKATFSIKSEQNKGTHVSIKIPI